MAREAGNAPGGYIYHVLNCSAGRIAPFPKPDKPEPNRWLRDSLHMARARKETADFANYADMTDDHDDGLNRKERKDAKDDDGVYHNDTTTTTTILPRSHEGTKIFRGINTRSGARGRGVRGGHGCAGNGS